MNAEVQTALIVAIPPTLVAIGGVILALKSQKKLDHITVLTNSTLTTANEKIDSLEKSIQILLKERNEKS